MCRSHFRPAGCLQKSTFNQLRAASKWLMAHGKYMYLWLGCQKFILPVYCNVFEALLLISNITYLCVALNIRRCAGVAGRGAGTAGTGRPAFTELSAGISAAVDVLGFFLLCSAFFCFDRRWPILPALQQPSCKLSTLLARALCIGYNMVYSYASVTSHNQL